jgi:hypothetical protein
VLALRIGRADDAFVVDAVLLKIRNSRKWPGKEALFELRFGSP